MRDDRDDNLPRVDVQAIDPSSLPDVWTDDVRRKSSKLDALALRCDCLTLPFTKMRICRSLGDSGVSLHPLSNSSKRMSIFPKYKHK
eukprot:1153712-Prymnesium_polylepis.1